MSSLWNCVSQIVFGTLLTFIFLTRTVSQITLSAKKFGDSIFILGVIGPAKNADKETTFLHS